MDNELIAHYCGDVLRARQQITLEREQERLAFRRVQTARDAARMAMLTLLEQIPDEAGAEVANQIPWEEIYHSQNDGLLHMHGGSLIRDGIKEAMQYCRILGRIVVIQDVNGANVVIHPGATYQDIAQAHKQSGGSGS